MFKEPSLNFKTHFESLNFEVESSSYDRFSEDGVSRVFRPDYYGELRVLVSVCIY